MSRTSVRWASAFLAWSILFNISAIPTTAAPSRLQSSPQASVPSVLKPGVPVERGLKGGETHAFQIPLKAGQFCSVVVEQKGIDVSVAALAPDGNPMVEIDSPNGLHGPEPVLLLPRTSGNHALKVRSSDAGAKPGGYTVRIVEIRAAAPGDQARIAWQAAMIEGFALMIRQTKETSQKALSAFERATEQARTAGDKPLEAEALNYVGLVSENLGGFDRAKQAFESALSIWDELNIDAPAKINTFMGLGSVYQALREPSKARALYSRLLDLQRNLKDRRGEAIALLFLGSICRTLGEPDQALLYLNQALPVFREMNDPDGESGALNLLGAIYTHLGETRKALDCFTQAVPLLEGSNNQNQLGVMFSNIGLCFLTLGEPHKAVEQHAKALAVHKKSGNVRRQISALNHLGLAFDNLSEFQKALDTYNQALALHQTLGNWSEAATLFNNLGNVHRNLGDLSQALHYQTQALQARRSNKDRVGEGITLNNLGSLHLRLGDLPKAAECFNQALDIARSVKDKAGESSALSNLGGMNFTQGNPEKAVEFHSEALRLKIEIGDRRGEALVRQHLAADFIKAGRLPEAREQTAKALDIARQVGERQTEADLLAISASLESTAKNYVGARSLIEDAIKIQESIRRSLSQNALKTSYSSIFRPEYDLYVFILMQLHKQDPKAGHDLEALQVSERARARSMLELLTEARFDIRRGVDPELLERERSLRQLLNAKEDRRLRIFAGKSTPEQKREIENEVATIGTELRETEAKIRAASPKYAALTQPAPLSAKGVQEQILDADTVLFEYFLGEKRSWLWVVTPTSVTTHELPSQDEIEEAAEDFRDALIAERSGKRNITSLPKSADETEDTLPDYKTAADRLSRMILGPAAAHLNAKRIVVVPDGALHYVPFAALPVPRKEREQTASFSALLIERSEIVVLPSASTLGVLRRETAGRKPAEKTLAVFADPVFTERDDRVAEARSRSMKSPASPEPPPAVSRGVVLNVPGNPLKNVARDELQIERSLKLLAEKLPDSDELRIPRLPFTRVEAERITALAPAGETWTALDFRAGRDQVLDPELGRYRIVHFATHGYVDAERPELSALLLSMFDEQGNPRDGFLRTHEIYNLNLPADLVVLSACKTGLGKNVKGEGLVGMTRGFMYAGAKRVVVSLWAVNDKATAELMTEFYDGMLRRNLRPAAALRAAQIKLLKRKPWSAPFFWAGFQIQGDWW